MIVLDTHIWVWWVQGDPQLKADRHQVIQANESSGLGVSAISVWEVAKLVAGKRIDFGRSAAEWIGTALGYPGVVLVPLTPDIAVESCNLPGPIHKDPADQIVIATARVLDVPLMTADGRIVAYPHVEHA
jgi:PIN domain nuclease of toxin-antitoxin system